MDAGPEIRKNTSFIFEREPAPPEGAGKTLIPSLINLISMWGVRIPLAVLMAPASGLRGVWTAMCIELVIRGSLFIIMQMIWSKRDRNERIKNHLV